nr:phytoene/squalene synthase family protein [uncultured Rhodopila sp.]
MPQLSNSEAADMAACHELIRGGSLSFHAASRLLPRKMRDPAIALYAFCREADDVIDNAVAGSNSLGWLQERLALIYAGRPMDVPADRAFARIVDRFAIPRELPEALLDGFAWDSEGRRYRTFSDVRAYSVRVAGTVGAMMAVLMGVRDAERMASAVDLGVAMQLSNIARDVGEDARNGRLYLPMDWMIEAGVDPDEFLAAPAYSEAIGSIVHRLLYAAEGYYGSASAGIARLPMNCRFGIGAAGLLYAEIGREVARRGMDSISGRAVVSGRRKVWVLASGLGDIAFSGRSLSPQPVPEGLFLVDAVVQNTPRTIIDQRARPWWAVGDRLVWTMDLFASLEERGRVRP